MNNASDLSKRLQELHERTRETPLFNPVFQLSLELSRLLESGKLSLDEAAQIIAELEGNSIEERAARLRNLIDPQPEEAQMDRIAQLANCADFDGFRAMWERPFIHAVFTAHPTFLLGTQACARVAALAQDPNASPCSDDRKDDEPITLLCEHRAAMEALANAQDARDEIVSAALAQAARKWPDQWRSVRPMPFRFASWVGYDMDGRTDIRWFDSIRFRLTEKHERLTRYAAALSAIDPLHPLNQTLIAARDHTAARLADFEGDLTDPKALSHAANALTQDDEAKLLSLTPIANTLDDEADTCEDSAHAVKLKTLASAMRADGLGMGWIHFRVNASQLHNAIRRRIDPENQLDLASRGALSALRILLADAQPLSSNFAALAIESSTAIRQFLAMAQILKHIDGDAPLRMLIAECEQPATILAALYFTKVFGIAGKVDISPLFETETALEHGGRFLDQLLGEDAYQSYVKERGRLCIQTGFSDAGRFVGQIPASLAIERLQGRLAEAMSANGLTAVRALIFNTHGESMGRGAHPSGISDRLAWPLSPWARRRFARAGIALEPEVSFQGGDGYLLFKTSDLALATLVKIATHDPRECDVDVPKDPFYRRTDLSLDFYRAIRKNQRDHLKSHTYSRALTAFGLGLLRPTGSRVSRRQSDLNADRELSLRQIRAIPHNAILQQLGYPVNIISGLGTAAEGAYEDIAQLLTDSARGRQIIRLVRASNALASIKTVAAYGELFNSAYWASRTYRGNEDHLSNACEALAEYLTKDDRAGVFRRLASRLRVDALKLHRLLALIPDDESAAGRESVRRHIGVLQAMRLALMQHMFLKVVSIPAFSRANDISRDDVLEMVFTLRIDDALAQLRRAYPTSFPSIDDFDIAEPSEYPDGDGENYAAIRRDYIDPIADAYDLCLRISVAVANHFGAHG